jgi:hypothetical protein
MHVSRPIDDAGGRFVRPPTTAQIRITSLPSGTVVYEGPGPGLGAVMFTTPPPDGDTALGVETT